MIKKGDKFKHKNYPEHQCIVTYRNEEFVQYKIINSHFTEDIGSSYIKSIGYFKGNYIPLSNFKQHKSKLNI